MKNKSKNFMKNKFQKFSNKINSKNFMKNKFQKFYEKMVSKNFRMKNPKIFGKIIKGHFKFKAGSKLIHLKIWKFYAGKFSVGKFHPNEFSHLFMVAEKDWKNDKTMNNVSMGNYIDIMCEEQYIDVKSFPFYLIFRRSWTFTRCDHFFIFFFFFKEKIFQP